MAQAATIKAPNYLAVFGWLVGLTIFEVAITYFNLDRATLATMLIASSIGKAALVVLYFMHLRHEVRFILTMIIVTTLLATVFVLGLFPDIVIGYWK